MRAYDVGEAGAVELVLARSAAQPRRPHKLIEHPQDDPADVLGALHTGGSRDVEVLALRLEEGRRRVVDCSDPHGVVDQVKRLVAVVLSEVLDEVVVVVERGVGLERLDELPRGGGAGRNHFGSVVLGDLDRVNAR